MPDMPTRINQADYGDSHFRHDAVGNDGKCDMKPLRPHNWYKLTDCPARATGQVDTIRSLIPEEETEMNHIIQVTPKQYYFVGPGYRTFLGPTPTGLAESGVPVLSIGQPGAPKTLDSLWAIPSLEEMILGYVKRAGREGTGG